MEQEVIQLGVVVPVYNEAENLPGFVAEWLAALERLEIRYRLWFVNDGSRDKSGAVLEEVVRQNAERVRVIHQQNAGHGAACRRGYEAALEQGAEWVLQVDSDGQCDAAYLREFWAGKEAVDCVFGERHRRDDGWQRSLISRACAVCVGWVSGVRMVDLNVPYRLMRGVVLAAAMVKIPRDFGLQNIALSIALKRGDYRWRFIPIHFRARAGGMNSIHLGSILKLGWKLMADLRRLPA